MLLYQLLGLFHRDEQRGSFPLLSLNAPRSSLPRSQNVTYRTRFTVRLS